MKVRQRVNKWIDVIKGIFPIFDVGPHFNFSNLIIFISLFDVGASLDGLLFSCKFMKILMHEQHR